MKYKITYKSKYGNYSLTSNFNSELELNDYIRMQEEKFGAVIVDVEII